MKVQIIVFTLTLLALTLIWTSPNSVAAEGGTWETKEPLPRELWDFNGAVGFEGKIYFFFDSATYIYDPLNESITQRNAMPIKGGEGETFVLAENYVYVIGNVGNSMFFEEYNIQNDTWTIKNSPSRLTYGNMINAVGSKVYVTDSESGLNEVFNPELNSWTVLSPMPETDYTVHSVCIDDKIYFIQSKTTLIYNTHTDKWTTGATVPESINGGVGATTGVNAPVRIYIMGAGEGLCDNLVYDLSNDTWSTGASLPTARYSRAIVVLNDKLYVIGGGIIGYGEISGIIEVYTPDNYNTIKPTATPTEIPQLTFIQLIAGIVVASIIITVIGITVYHFKHVPTKANKPKD
jgi:N-acetylneuraminic acid mutarotase